MSYSSQGWAQRQRFGAPILKAVMQALCYLMRDDELTVWCAVTGGREVDLEKLTEYEARAIRKALADLVELGYLLDTGERRRNMVVWRLPRYEAWLLRAENETPPQDGRGPAQTSERPAQDADPAAKNLSDIAPVSDPSRDGEGSSENDATPPVQVPDPSRPRSATPPVHGRESSLDLRSTKPARATRLEEWRQRARLLHDRAPERHGPEVKPGTALKAHWRLWRQMVGWYGRLWLEQWGPEPTAEWIRLLNLWNDSGRWTELDLVLEAMTLERPPKPPMVGEVEAVFRATKATGRPRVDAGAVRAYWWNVVRNEAFSLAPLYGIGKRGITSFDGIDYVARATVEAACEELVETAISAELAQPPKPRAVVQEIVTDTLVRTMKPFAPVEAARRAAVNA